MRQSSRRGKTFLTPSELSQEEARAVVLGKPYRATALRLMRTEQWEQKVQTKWLDWYEDNGGFHEMLHQATPGKNIEGEIRSWLQFGGYPYYAKVACYDSSPLASGVWSGV